MTVNQTPSNTALAVIAADSLANIEQEAEFEIDAAIAIHDVHRVWLPENVAKYALLPTLVWGRLCAKAFAHFKSELLMQQLNRAIREQQMAQMPNGRRNGAYVAEGDWQKQIIRSDADKMLPVMENIALHLENHSDWRDVLGYNELTAGYEVLQTPPEPVTALPGTEIEDHFDTEVTRWLERKGLMVKPAAVRAVIDAVARKQSYHPVRDYLNGIPAWDGTPRIGSWLIDYCGVPSSDADPNIYAEAVGEKFLISAVARVMEPGCKADHLLILEGEQGIGKSTAARVLANGWFTDQIDALGGKDSMMQLRGVWIVELPELDALGRAEMSRAKAFLTNQVERFRVPYGRRVVQVPRQCVFIGTTNSDAWLKDETGGRRFWPVKCYGRIDTDGLAKQRDQMWAEALLRYKEGVHWWLEDSDLVKKASGEQRARYQDDVWQETVMNAAGQICALSDSCSIHEILSKIGVDTSRQDQVAANRVARCLRVAGWEQYRQRAGSGIERRYREPDKAAK